ncbi:Sensory box histidine kinase/response regulator [hydrothermal vent metagenome]|uniref:Sensory box histidine kinase/response regulator n=1 Tax=hydrothermal vent metagenome TaxID=652676 RepID=A0A3B0YJW4_9ZZZZ
MSSNRIKYILLGISALLLLSFLFIMTKTVDTQRHKKIFNQINQLMRVDATLNQHILEIHQGLLPHYDPVVEDIKSLNQLQSNIAVLLIQLPADNTTEIKQQLEVVSLVVSQKSELLERFKSSNALLINSLRYLPVITSQLIKKLPNTIAAAPVKHELNELLHNTLIYNLTSERSIKKQSSNAADSLTFSFESQFPERQKELSILLAHIKIAMNQKHQIDTFIPQLLKLPSTQQIEKLLKVYIEAHNRLIQRANDYRLALYAFSVLLLTYIAFILLKLRQTAYTLRHTIADLNYQKFAMDQHAIVSITDSKGIITYANEAFCKINARKASELIGQSHHISRSSSHPPAFFENIWRTISRGNVWHGQIQNNTKDNDAYWIETTIVPFMNEDNTPYQYVAISTDITQIKLAGEALRESRQHMNDAQRMAHIGHWEHDLIHHKLEWSDEIYRILDLATDHPKPSYKRFIERVHVDDRKKVNAVHKKSIHNNKAYSIEYRLRMDDEKIKHIIERSETFFDDRNNAIRSVGTIQDITERFNMEEALRRSQKMEAIGQLSGGIAHDFNNQLGITLGYLDFLKEHYSNDEKPQKWICNATKATSRCVDLTRQLLTFARRQSSDKTLISLNAALKDMDAMIARSITPEVDIEYSLADDLWLTETTLGEFQDAILNLTLNARDAMPNGGKLIIETANKHLDKDYTALNPDAKTGDYIQILVSDNGTGMNAATLEHVFEPFYTTKPEGKGTGLGMSMVYGFMERNDGYIKIYSEPDIGTSIRLYLPRARSVTNTEVNPHNDDTNLPTGTESILIVDDEADLLQLADQYLSDLGYHIYTAENARQAILILAAEKNIHLLFSDIVMPGGINGYELAQQATELCENIKVLLTSGFTSKTITNSGLTHFASNILSKPYRKADLAKRIRLVLDSNTDDNYIDNTQDSSNQLKDCRILVIDDDEEVLELFLIKLGRLGCKTITSRNANDAINIYQQSLQNNESVDIVIIDLILPGGLDGQEIANRIRALNPQAKILICSGYSEGPEMLRPHKYGFNGALDKSFNLTIMRHTLEQVLSLEKSEE